MAATAVLIAGALWGGRAWWGAGGGELRAFRAVSSVRIGGERRQRGWTSAPGAANPGRALAWRRDPNGRWNDLLPEHGKLMHLFPDSRRRLRRVRHLHPVPDLPAARRFGATLPPLPSGHYRLFADIVHESGYAQTIVSGRCRRRSRAVEVTRPDDSTFEGPAESSTIDACRSGEIEWVRTSRSWPARADAHVQRATPRAPLALGLHGNARSRDRDA